MPEINTSNPQNTTQVANIASEKGSAGFDKVLGYLLLSAGLMVIILSTLYAVFVLTGKFKPVKVFDVKAPEIPVPSVGQAVDLSSLQNSGLPQEVLNSLNNPKTSQPAGIKILPDDVFSTLLNMFISYILVMVHASSGSRIASIGVSLIKDIKVRSKTA